MTDKKAMAKELEELAKRFSEGWHEGIKIDASDIMLLSQAAEALAQRTEQEPDDIASIIACRDMLDAQLVPPRTWVGKGDLEDSNAYLTPPQRTWVGLTEEDRAKILSRKWWDFEDEFDVDGFLRLAEAKLKEKNT